MAKFRENKSKYRPTTLGPLKKNFNIQNNQKDDNSSNSESAFLTNVNIPEPIPLTLNDQNLENAKKLFLTANEVENNPIDQDEKDAKMKEWHQFNIFKSSSKKMIKPTHFKNNSQALKNKLPKSSEVIRTIF